jgi:dimeric dUTPase (all-alpha-NTP-PPase superfamily)
MVNINDVANELIPTPTANKDQLDLIFDRQLELTLKYMPIKKSNGQLFYNDIPVDINDRFGQAQVHYIGHCFIVELGEALEARDKGLGNSHFHEELIDGLHFLVEVMLLSNINSNEIISDMMGDKLDSLFESQLDHKSIRIEIYNVIRDYSIAMNYLKMKSWKQTHVDTNIFEYRKALIKLFYTYIKLLKVSGLKGSSSFELYFKKSVVNKFRQESNY